MVPRKLDFNSGHTHICNKIKKSRKHYSFNVTFQFNIISFNKYFLEKTSTQFFFNFTFRAIFFLCVTPNILNGFHVSSYTLLGHLPDDQWCVVDDLKVTNWTVEQQRNIAEKDLRTHGCTIWDWDYKHLSTLSYADALNYTDRMSLPDEISCKVKGAYEYEAPETTFVSEWELVCDRAIQRTSAQMFISLGKFFGSFSFGIFADK